MNENDHAYIFPCFRHARAFFRKKNYEKHQPFHMEISGLGGRCEIEETLLNPDCITAYAEKNKLGQVVKKTEVYYQKIGKRNSFQGKTVLDHWKVIIVFNENKKQWEVATAFIRSSPPYAMINNRIESVIYDKHENK